MADEFSNESFCTVIFDEFFLAGLGRDNVTRHLLKLLWYIHPKLPSARLHSLLKALQPTSQVILHNIQISLRSLDIIIMKIFYFYYVYVLILV